MDRGEFGVEDDPIVKMVGVACGKGGAAERVLKAARVKKAGGG